MNSIRKKKLSAIIGKLEEIHSELEAMRDEERDQFDGLSEKAQESERGEKIDESANSLEQAADDLETAKDSIIDAISE